MPYTSIPFSQSKPNVTTCQQRIDPSGWKIEDGQLITFPHCLTVVNSRFGSRFSFNWYFSQQEVTSSVLGTLEDRNTHLVIRIKRGNQEEQIFPLLPNGNFTTQSVNLGLTSQKTVFKNNHLDFLLDIISPFSPSDSAESRTNQINSAPFFYLDLSLVNRSDSEEEVVIDFLLTNYQEVKQRKHYETIYLNDQVRSDGIRALSWAKDPGVKAITGNKLTGASWKVKLAPLSSQTKTLVYAGFLDKEILIDASSEKERKLIFAYNRWFDDIDEVIDFAFLNEKEIRKKSEDFEKMVLTSSLSPQQKWLLAQTFHSYLSNTWLVYEPKKKNELEYYVWEGEFKYLNTVDVAYDYALFEGKYFPWVIKLELESWKKHAKKDEKGIVIPHDLGRRFRIAGSQAYTFTKKGDEERNKTSIMPVEENANFILLTYWYWKKSNDNQFLDNLLPLINNLVDSLIARDSNNNGIADKDIGITTYDNDGNLALKEGPDNSYLALKQLAAYLTVEEMSQFLNNHDLKEKSGKQAQLITQSLKEAYQNHGLIPLSLDPQFVKEESHTIITGLLYPAITNLKSKYLEELIPILKENYRRTYEKSLVKDSKGKIIGLKLAENQSLDLGWFSHSVVADIVAQKLFNQNYQSEIVFFPYLYDNPYSFADGQYFKKPFDSIKTSLIFYPRGVVIFGKEW